MFVKIRLPLLLCLLVQVCCWSCHDGVDADDIDDGGGDRSPYDSDKRTQYFAMRTTVHQTFHTWLFPSQPSMEVARNFTENMDWEESAELSTRLLVRAGIPLLYDIGSRDDVAVLREIYHFFIAPQGTCVLPYPNEPLLLYYALVPAEAEQRYGLGRLSLFAPLRLPTAAFATLLDEDSQILPWERRELEAQVLRAASLTYTALVGIVGDSTRFVLPLHDVSVRGSLNSPMVYASLDAAVKRQRLLELLRSREEYAKKIDVYDQSIRLTAAERKARNEHDAAVRRRQEEGQREYREKLHAHLAEYRQRQREALARQSQRRQHTSALRTTAADSAAAEAKNTQRTKCLQLQQVTRHSTSMPPFYNDRLDELLRRGHCADFVDGEHANGHNPAEVSGRAETAEDNADAKTKTALVPLTPCHVSALPTLRQSFCDDVSYFARLRGRTGEAPTTPQVLSFLLARYAQNRTVQRVCTDGDMYNNNNDKTADYAAVPPLEADETFAEAVEDFSAEDFTQFSLYWIRNWGRTLDTVDLPRECAEEVSRSQLIPEVLHGVGVQLLLLSRPAQDGLNETVRNTTDASTRVPLSLARAAVMIQQASWWGSMAASNTLSTFREIGLLFRVHRAVAMQMRLHSRRRTDSHMLKSLFETLAPLPSTSHTVSPPISTAANRSPRAASVEQLLLRERVISSGLTWGGLNRPIATMASLQSFSSVSLEDLGDDTEGKYVDYDEPENTENLQSNLQGYIHLSSIKLVGFRELAADPQTAECQLLTMLRSMRFSCDVDGPWPDTLSTTSTSSSRCTSAVDLLRALPARASSRIDCSSLLPGNAPRRDETAGNGIIPTRKTQRDTLLTTLLLTAYLHLIHTRDYRKAFLYSFHALRLNALSRQRSRRDAAHRGEREASRKPASERYTYTGEVLTVLSASLIGEKLAHSTSDHSSVRRPNLVTGVLVPFLSKVLHAPLRVGDDDGEASVVSEYDVLYSLLAATASRWKDTERIVHPLQFDDNLAHHTDAFYLMQFLLKRRLAKVKGLRALAPHVTALFRPGAVTFLPRPFDEEDTLAQRINEYELSEANYLLTDVPYNVNGKASEPGADESEVAGVAADDGDDNDDEAEEDDAEGDGGGEDGGVGDTTDTSEQQALQAGGRMPKTILEMNRGETRHSDPLERRAVLAAEWLDPTLSLSHTRYVLRVTSDFRRLPTSFVPVLYLSDHDYYLREGRKYLSNRIRDALRYVFTDTTAESLVRRLARSVFPPPPLPYFSPADGHHNNDTNDDSDEEVPWHVQSLTGALNDDSASSLKLRSFVRGVLTLATSLETSHPTGFALLFHSVSASPDGCLGCGVSDVSPRNCDPLCTFLDLLAQDVLGWQSPAVWRQHRQMAQWNSHNVRTAGSNRWAELGTNSPFDLSSAESRQELFVAVERWLSVRPGEGETQSPHDTFDVGMRRLALCAGLPRKPQRGAPDKSTAGWLPFDVPVAPYDGAYFPAADMECLIEIMRRVGQSGSSSTSAGVRPNGGASDGVPEFRRLLELTEDLAMRLRYYYKHTTIPSLDRLPLYSEELSSTPTAATAMESPTAYSSAEKKWSTGFLVEPWYRLGDVQNFHTEYLPLGEGMFFNLRLHRLTGIHQAARFKLLLARLADRFDVVKRLLPQWLLQT